MPRVPVYETAVSDQAQPQARISAPEFPSSSVGNTQQKFGEGMMRGAASLGAIQEAITQDVNQTRVIDAVNNLTLEKELLTYGKNPDGTTVGYSYLKGQDALKNTKGDSSTESVTDYYSQKFKDKIDSLSKTLGNDAQRLRFSQAANTLHNQFVAGVNQHSAREYENYKLNTLDNQIKLGVTTATRNWMDFENPTGVFADQIALVKNGVIAASAARGYQGTPANKATGEPAKLDPTTKQLVDDTLSKLHQGVVNSIITSGTFDQAQKYVKQFSEQIDPPTKSIVDQQLRMFAVKETTAKVSALTDSALSVSTGWREPAGPYAENKKKIIDTVENLAVISGFGKDSDYAQDLVKKANTNLAGQVVNQMLTQNKTGEAAEFLASVSTQIDQGDYQKLYAQVKKLNTTQLASTEADNVWTTTVGASNNYNKAVDLFKMEAAVREKYKDNPELVTETINQLRNRKTAWDASQGEMKAGNTNAVMEMISKGQNYHKSSAWLSLDATSQRSITEHLQDRAYAMKSRSIQEENQHQQQIAKKTFPAYLTYSNPDVLEKMSRQEVQALLPQLGDQHTATLLQRWESLQNAEGKRTAHIDVNTFNEVAQEFDLRPYKENKTEQEKIKLGLVKSRVDDALDALAKTSRDKISVEQKTIVMRDIMARTITTEGFLWGTTTVPAATLSPQDVQKIVVPPDRRSEIIKTMSSLYSEFPDNKDYAPTEINVKKFFYNMKLRGYAK